jgi:hypothetical protein
VFEFPHVEAIVEALLEGDAGIVPCPCPANLNQEKLVDGLFIPSRDLFWWTCLHTIPEGEVPQILQEEKAVVDPVSVQSRDSYSYSAEKTVEVKKGKLLEGLAKEAQLL